VKVLKKLIEIFTDPGDVVIDPCAGSGSTLVAAIELDRKAYGFEIKRNFHADASKWIKQTIQRKKDIKEFGFNKTETEKVAPTLF
jgi:site-specific DNA-methyltransferase (adenine-specific)